jgi:hypothetical protein
LQHLRAQGHLSEINKESTVAQAPPLLNEVPLNGQWVGEAK